MKGRGGTDWGVGIVKKGVKVIRQTPHMLYFLNLFSGPNLYLVWTSIGDSDCGDPNIGRVDQDAGLIFCRFFILLFCCPGYCNIR